ncbi:DKNYY domain-containing protein [Dysgonomonas sp. 25]|uniref:DKNYY domain-containing protein n=1 Tax=Dysgonomonas sp. 25 TaxID=2302933 RepID=UPI0013D85284|nr:DKNYY domain-containing protein [Dysgonomonas sp. 25]NDV68497.1 hypothetical protein [Dysgonomonas sp. 25]
MKSAVLLILSFFCIAASLTAQTEQDSVVVEEVMEVEENPLIIEDIDGNWVSCRSSDMGISYPIRNNKVYYEENCMGHCMKREFVDRADIRTFRYLGDKYAKDKNWVYFEGKIVLGAEPKSFKIIKTLFNRDFAIDKKSFFCRGKRIPGVSPKGKDGIRELSYYYYTNGEVIFTDEGKVLQGVDYKDATLLGNSYIIADNKVYYHADVIEGADAATFAIIEEYYRFFKDKNKIYYDGKELYESDAQKEIKVLDYGYLINNDKVFYHNETLNYADTETFGTIEGKYGYGKDDKLTYYWGDVVDDGRALVEKNYPSKFYFVGNELYDSWGYSLRCEVDTASFRQIGDYLYTDDEYIYAFSKEYNTMEKKRCDNEGFTRISERYAKDSKDIYYLHTGQRSVQFSYISHVDYATFEVIQDDWAKDKKRCYYQSYSLPYADPKIMLPIDSFYAVSDDKFFYKYRWIEGADASSFCIIDDTYSKDKDHVYREGRVLPDCDPSTFRLIENPVSYDKNNVYSYNKQVAKVDGATLTHFFDDWYKDKDSLYWLPRYHLFDNKVNTTAVDSETITRFEDNYFQDKDHLYIGLLRLFDGAQERFWHEKPHIEAIKRIEGADRSSFQVINSKYAKDKNHVYFEGEVIPGADPLTFFLIRKVGDSSAYDKSGIYDATRKRTSLNNPITYLGDIFYVDKDFLYEIYHAGAAYKYRLKDVGLDRKTLKVIEEGVLRDKNGTYNWKEHTWDWKRSNRVED